MCKAHQVWSDTWMYMYHILLYLGIILVDLPICMSSVLLIMYDLWEIGIMGTTYVICTTPIMYDHVIYGKLASWIGYASLIRMNSQEKLEIIYTESNCTAHHHHFCFYDQRGLFQSSCIDGWKNKTRNLMQQRQRNNTLGQLGTYPKVLNNYSNMLAKVSKKLFRTRI